MELNLQILSDESFVCYEWIEGDLKIKPISECRCDERLKTKALVCLLKLTKS
jgi:hypothetical protein